MSALLAALTADPGALDWGCADERARGDEVLSIARPGLQLLSAAGAPMVPRAIFYGWVFAAGERLLRAYIGFGHLEESEGTWLAQALAMVSGCAEPPSADASEWKFPILAHLASLNTFAAIRGQRAREMGEAFGWVRDALTWAGKRHLGDRRCRIEPPWLMASAASIHGAIARHRGGDEDAARAAERADQLRSLLDLWRNAAA